MSYMCICIHYAGNVKKLADSVKSDESAISKLKDEEKNKLEVQYMLYTHCHCMYCFGACIREPTC